MMHYCLVLEEPNWHRMQEGVAMMERVPGLGVEMMEFLRHRPLLLCLSDIQRKVCLQATAIPAEEENLMGLSRSRLIQNYSSTKSKLFHQLG